MARSLNHIDVILKDPTTSWVTDPLPKHASYGGGPRGSRSGGENSRQDARRRPACEKVYSEATVRVAPSRLSGVLDHSTPGCGGGATPGARSCHSFTG